MGLLLALSAPAWAGEVLSTTVAADGAVERTCHSRALSGGQGYATRSLTAPDTGWITARLAGSGDGDWDLAVFDATTGRLVAASAYRGSKEVAQGFAAAGDRLTVQACRRSGAGHSASLTVSSQAIGASEAETISMVRVSTPNAARKRELTSLGLDLTEHGRDGYVEVVLHGERDAKVLRDHKFVFTTTVADLVAQDRKDRLADRAYARSAGASALPSGRTAYRRLADYSADMKKLVDENPDLVKPITLNHETYEGRPVEGIEITSDVGARDGKPVFLQMGVHHAREWPSSEHAMEWAFELVNGYRAGDSRVRRLVEETRTIVVPIVNPDGFNASREAGELQAGGGGRGGNETANILGHPVEYRRKNCRFFDDSEGGSCVQPALGAVEAGVDLNRNYGGFWGGPGASGQPEALDYRGPGPFSEPETQNIRELVSSRQVTTLITNHTFSNLVLRPPGIQLQGAPPDEEIYKALGDSMAAENGYESQRSYQLYDTTGTTEDWTYYATGGLGFTFEIGPANFHPPFADTVAEYEGTTAAAGAGGGNREAYFKAQESTADTARHSVIEGSAPPGAILRLRKSFKTMTSPVIGEEGAEGEPIAFDDTLDTTMEVPASGAYEWHVNPSTRPIAVEDQGRPATGEPSPPVDFETNGPGSTIPCADVDDPPPDCYEDHLFEVPGGPGIDNARATVRIEWNTPASDWDMKIYEADADGNAAGEPIAASTQGTTTFEQTTLAEPAPGRYVVRVINYSAAPGADDWTGRVTFGGPRPFEPARTETWTLTCESPDGTVRSTQEVLIARGERRAIDPCPATGAAAPPAANPKVTTPRKRARRCFPPGAHVGDTTIGKAHLGYTRRTLERRLGPPSRRNRRAYRYCVAGGGTLLVSFDGKGRARLIASTARTHRTRRISRGSSARRLLRAYRLVRLSNRLYATPGGNRKLFGVKAGKVRYVAVVDRRVLRNRRELARHLRNVRL